MDDTYKEIIWRQFGAAIDMLNNAITACPNEVWFNRTKKPEFWYVAYHAIFWLDYYLTGDVERFSRTAPFGLEELDPSGVIPERPFTKDELREYLTYCRKKCQTTIETMLDDKAKEVFRFGRVDLSFAELLLYNLRHVQHHAGQLNLILRQNIDSAPGWVFGAKNGD